MQYVAGIYNNDDEFEAKTEPMGSRWEAEQAGYAAGIFGGDMVIDAVNMDAEDRAVDAVLPSSRELFERFQAVSVEEYGELLKVYGAEGALLAAMGLMNPETHRPLSVKVPGTDKRGWLDFGLRERVFDGGSSGERALVYIAISFWNRNELFLCGTQAFKGSVIEAFAHLGPAARTKVIMTLEACK